MADNKEQVILEVVIKNDAASKHIQENKKRIVELREEQALLNKTTKDGKDEYEAYAIEIKRLGLRMLFGQKKYVIIIKQ